MPEIFVNNGVADSVKHPEAMEVVYNHPITKKPGHYLLRRGAPQLVWDKKEHRNKWVVPTEVEEIHDHADGEQVYVLADGYFSEKDFAEIAEEMAVSRGKRRRNKPTFAPPAAVIKEACHEIEIRQTMEYTNPDTGHVWQRPSIGLLLPRNSEWANALAEQSKRDWSTKRRLY